jgi:hypothetical protein
LPTDVNESLRRFIAESAAYRCEYCLLHEDDSYSPHQIDYIISRKHGGSSDAGNLAYACIRCNAWKGSGIGTVDPLSGALVHLFHSRRHRWDDHFLLRGAVIEPLTQEGALQPRGY